MIVCHIIKVTRVAGAEQHLLSLAAGLRQRHIDAQIIVLVEPANPVPEFVALAHQYGIPIHSLVIKRDFDLSLISRLHRLLSALRPQIVHTHLQHADLHGILAGRLARTPVVMTSRHNDNAFRRRAPFRHINRLLWKWVDAGVVISDALGRFAIEIEGAPAHKLHTIHYGMSPLSGEDRSANRRALRAQLNIGLYDAVIGIVCRLVEQKGVSYGLRAFQMVIARFPSAHLVIAGDGPLRAALQTEAASLGLGEHVQFLGWRDDVSRLMTAFDLLLVPSLWEGFGLVILEAMAQQIPAVGSAVSAIPEIIIHGETGLLVPPRDVQALAEALALLLGDSALRRYMGMMAEDRLETHFSANRMVDQTADVYQSLLCRKEA